MVQTAKAVAVALMGMIAAEQALAQEIRTRGGGRVTQINEQVFEVSRARSDTAFWCAAGDYVRRKLDVPWQTDIFVVRGEGTSPDTGRRFTAQFTVSPAGLNLPQGRRGAISLNPGDSQSVTQAFGYCEDLLLQRSGD
ncbi:MAG: hypothetical protein OIF47_08265 [Marinibacterium sp.]|nr:hypothetical protein [Marinibacterium sp.]